ncbi:MAG: hypothetical protein H0V81_08020, partial [Solirubrobacterales bacterium]|nr:hypothetical protein [Solirubrobacterales bacterium]
MLNLSPRLAALLAATALAGVSGATIAGAASSGTTGSTSSQRPAGGPGADETALTGETKQKVEAAVSAKLPGATILRTETDRGGVYESHVRKADGTEVEVKVAKDFTVTSVEERSARGRGPGGHRRHGGPGGRGMHADLAAVAKALGVTEAKLQSAVEAARPDRSAGKQDKGAERTAAIAKSLGESTGDVKAVLDS